nr:hypothetical protein [Tanacetum cinerariifolium]
MDVTPMNKTKKVRFTEPITSLGNKLIKTSSSSNIVSNKPMLSSTEVTLPTNASGSQPLGNTKKDRILQTPSSAKKNKLEADPRNVRTSLQNNKSVVNTKNIASVQESKLNERVLAITALKDTLRKVNGKAVVDEAHTQEETVTLREIVEHERSLNPLNTSLDYACDKLMDVTPMNKTKKVRFTEPITSLGNKLIKTSSSSNIVSNKPMLSSTEVTLPTNASGSQPLGNTKKDRILQTPSSAKKNKLEADPRNVRTSLQNNKSVVNTKNIASVQESKLNVSFDL